MTSTTRRPRVICHMMASIDGRISPSVVSYLLAGRDDVDLSLALEKADDVLRLRHRVVRS